MQDWEKFAWQKNDILVKIDGSVHLIFAGFSNDSYTSFTGKHVLDSEYVYYDKVDCIDTDDFIKASDDAAQTYINTLEKKQIVNLKPKIEFKPFDKVLVRNYNNEVWKCDFYSFNVGTAHCCIINGNFRQCIPYNEETAKLIGTTKDVEG